MSEEKQASFEGWAKVEVMGHQSHIGFVRTEAYGQAVMFRIDTPELPVREYALTTPEYVGGSWCPAGTIVQRASRPGQTVMVGAGSIYRICPCTEEVATRAIDRESRAELKLISLPAQAALPEAGASEGDEEIEQSDDEEVLF